jgi:hypothetical protein
VRASTTEQKGEIDSVLVFCSKQHHWAEKAPECKSLYHVEHVDVRSSKSGSWQWRCRLAGHSVRAPVHVRAAVHGQAMACARVRTAGSDLVSSEPFERSKFVPKNTPRRVNLAAAALRQWLWRLSASDTWIQKENKKKENKRKRAENAPADATKNYDSAGVSAAATASARELRVHGEHPAVSALWAKHRKEHKNKTYRFNLSMLGVCRCSFVEAVDATVDEII